MPVSYKADRTVLILTRVIVAAELRTELFAMAKQQVAVSTHLQEVTAELEVLCGTLEALWAHLFVGMAPEGPLADRVEAARGWLDDLIVEALYQRAHTAFTSVATHYNDVNFTTNGSGYAKNRTSEDLMQLGEMVAPAVQELVGQILRGRDLR